MGSIPKHHVAPTLPAMSSLRRPLLFNEAAKTWTAPVALTAEEKHAIDTFHGQFPGGPTRLVSLDDIACELGVAAVYLKDESHRFGLPAFKILGASWGTYRALARRLNLAIDTPLPALKEALAGETVTLYAASEGNHGRAVARMGSLLSIAAEIHVPHDMHRTTKEALENEGAKVVVNSGTYDDALETAKKAAESEGGVLVQDFSFQGYEDIPKWIVDGYMTMMREIDTQLKDSPPSLVVCPAGVGSFAQSVVSHFKRQGSRAKVMTVEPDTAACVYKSIRSDELVTVQTHATIMAGLDCGTPSPIAWPILKAGVDACSTVSDWEAHQATEYLTTQGVFPGTCAAAPLAAVRRLTKGDKSSLGLDRNSVVVLLCTEGSKEYETPMDVSMDDAVELTQALVRINSANPSLGSVPGPGESEIARLIAAWLEHRDIETHWIEPTKGRPSVVGVVRGSGAGKSLMFNGHIDTVTTLGYDDDPLSGEIRCGKLYGRGADDMKSGVAAALVALAAAKTQNLRGDVIFTGVADEEAMSIGTEQVLETGWRADAAIVNEPTGELIVHAHKGFVWAEVDVHGVAAHGSLPSAGVDAITKAGYFLVELDKYSDRLLQGWDDPVMAPTVHASTIKGGEEPSSYPALCTVVLERRTVGGETRGTVESELRNILDKLSKSVKDFQYDLRITFDRPPFAIETDHPFAALVSDIVSESLGRKAKFIKEPYWTDCALLASKGIPVLLWGPKGDGLHAKEEWADVESIQRVAKVLSRVASRFCS
ncbi:Diaminopropionate ammonia-lyase [Purpureocillium takamizusanense]|uniref:Probable succinyl-diaminopimelate desuccinylase n=1 Tax=Purpureocillium takamizusanense TaxID=2060973 RepID=A0A9Q8QS22_9HYPO|nr:Diaminopropionate ammonia-lyase [Purpureocillium takamizusanense]UNI24357.1 Diaminopropionate ammonia-lyase [Purpureocillium takamizusanense]